MLFMGFVGGGGLEGVSNTCGGKLGGGKLVADLEVSLVGVGCVGAE